MGYLYELEEDILALFVIVVIAAFIILAIFVNVIYPIIEEREYIKMEMKQSYSKEEYRYWKRELRYLYLRSIPLIGRFFR